MSLSIGIVGLPNSGKSTLFNALVKGHQAKVAAHPFTTIEPNVGIVEVPDERLEIIAQRLNLPKKVPETLKFIDIAGLVKNANLGEGLGNQFLGHIREADAILHILRVFENPDIPHIHEKVDPKYDLEIVKSELELAEIQKPALYVLNVSENQLGKYKSEIRQLADALVLSAKLELELIELPEKEQQDYLRSFGLKEPVLNRLIRESYKLLGLITFYTLKPEQIQAWSIKEETLTPQAAGKVHTDMKKGFIAAEVINFDDLISFKSFEDAKSRGKVRTEGKNYQIKEGDVVHFRFNV